MKQASVEKAHAKFSASGSDRWLNCALSVPLSETVVEQESSSYAAEGTDAHSCLEFLMKNAGNKSARKMAMKRWPIAMVEHAEAAIAYISDRHSPGTILLCETRADISELIGEPEMFGTFDAAIIEEFGDLHVFDYKYGAGVEVDATENTQMIFYALGMAYKYNFNFTRVVLHVIQPRIEWTDEQNVVHMGRNSQWALSIDDLLLWAEKFKEGVARTKEDEPMAAFGDWCRWCPAQYKCPEISKSAFDQAQIDFSPENSHEIALPIPNMMKPEMVSNVLIALKKLKTWTESVEEHALNMAKRGVKIPGFKLVNKRATRKWVNIEKVTQVAEMVYGDDAFDRDLKSPAQLEKSAKGTKLEAGVTKFILKHASNESSGVTIAPESDNRTEVSLIETDFADVPALDPPKENASLAALAKVKPRKPKGKRK